MGRQIFNGQNHESTDIPRPEQMVYVVTAGDVAEAYDWMVQDETGTELAPGESPWDRLTPERQNLYVRAVENAFGEIDQLETIWGGIEEARRGETGGS